MIGCAVAHKLNKERLKDELERRGWRLNQYHCWEVTGRTSKECERDWVEAVEASVECSNEEI